MTDLPDLWALPPEDFTKARDEAARADPANPANKVLKGLRRPTLSAWVVNTLVRNDPALVDAVLELGPQLADAQTGGDAAALRTLDVQRRQVVQVAVSRALVLADRSLSLAIRAEVAQTLEAGLADPASAEAVRSGRLVRPLSYAGFGPVDLSDAVADLPVPAATRTSGRTGAGAVAVTRSAATGTPASASGPASPHNAKRRAVLEQAALAAAGALDDAVRQADAAAAKAAGTETTAAEAETAARGAADRQERAVAAVVTARHALGTAEQALATAGQELSTARRVAREAASGRSEAGRAATRAQTRLAVAQQAADRARQALDRARRPGPRP